MCFPQISLICPLITPVALKKLRDLYVFDLRYLREQKNYFGFVAGNEIKQILYLFYKIGL